MKQATITKVAVILSTKEKTLSTLHCLIQNCCQFNHLIRVIMLNHATIAGCLKVIMALV